MEESEIELIVKKNDDSNDYPYKNIGLLEEYEYDMYFPDGFERNKKMIKLGEYKSLYQRIKDEVIVWLITGTVVGGAYIINDIVENYIIK